MPLGLRAVRRAQHKHALADETRACRRLGCALAAGAAAAAAAPPEAPAPPGLRLMLCILRHLQYFQCCCLKLSALKTSSCLWILMYLCGFLYIHSAPAVLKASQQGT